MAAKKPGHNGLPSQRLDEVVTRVEMVGVVLDHGAQVLDYLIAVAHLEA